MDIDLFLGFFVTDQLKEALKNANIHAVNHFCMGQDPNYLAMTTFEGGQWIGKLLNTPMSTRELSLLKKHVLSIATKFLPKDLIHAQPLRLIALPS